MADKTMQYKFAWIVCLNTIAFMQTAFAAAEPIGRFLPGEARVGGGVYIVGSEKIVLSRENHRIYKKAVVGDAAAQCEFAKILNPSIEPDDATPRVAAEAFAWAMRSAAQGYADGENYVGMSYKEGDGVPKNIRESEKWLSKAIDHGSAKAMCNLAILHIENGRPEKAVPFARKSAVSGYAPGQFLWGKMNYLGQGTPMDAEKAVGWFMRAHKQDDIDATSILALCYQQGNGVKKNLARAVELYETVANTSRNEAQIAVAKVALVSIYLSNELPDSKALALRWALESLRGGGEAALQKAGFGASVALMQFVVGSAYYEGECVKKNDELAREWLLKASMGGEPKANALLSVMAEAQRKREERQIAAKKAAEEAERKRREEERRRIAEQEREEREERRELARQRRERGHSTNQKQWDGKAAMLRRQYDALLSRYGLTESLFSVDNGCSELILLGDGFNEKYRIDYYLNGGYMTHTGTMPASVARQLVTLRVRIWVAEY